MTVVDEEQKIVFVKTHKTAGSSIELALSLALGKEAIVTLIMEDADRDVLRMHQPRNYLPTLSRPSRFWNHMTFDEVARNYVQRFCVLYLQHPLSAYTKIYTVRNPWSAWVSRFWWENTKILPNTLRHSHEEAVRMVWVRTVHTHTSILRPHTIRTHTMGANAWDATAVLRALFLVLCARLVALLLLPWVYVAGVLRTRAARRRRDEFLKRASKWSLQEARQHFKAFVMRRTTSEMREVRALVAEWQQQGAKPADQCALRMEHLQEDFDAMCKTLSLPTTALPRLKSASVVPAHLKVPYQDLYDDDARLHVAKVEGFIVETFKYSF